MGPPKNQYGRRVRLVRNSQAFIQRHDIGMDTTSLERSPGGSDIPRWRTRLVEYRSNKMFELESATTRGQKGGQVHLARGKDREWSAGSDPINWRTPKISEERVTSALRESAKVAKSGKNISGM